MPQLLVRNTLDRLPAAIVARLEPVAETLDYEAGRQVMREGETTPFLGVVEAGRVALRRRVAERGHRLTLVTVEPSELVGWSALIPPYRATVDAVTTEPTRIRAFAAGPLRDLLATDPEVDAALLALLLETVSGLLNASWSQLLDIDANREDQWW